MQMSLRFFLKIGVFGGNTPTAGSLFPTSIGAHSQLSIYGIAARQASTQALQMTA